MKEDIHIVGSQLVETVKNLIKEGNVRRVTVKNAKGEVVFELPLTIGVVGLAVAPLLAALGAVASLMADCTITVERDPEPGSANPPA